VDLFLSASPVELDRLAGEAMLLPESRRAIASNRMVVLVPAGKAPPANPLELAGPEYERIAMGNPRTAPVGRYAERALANLGLLGRLRPRLVLAENARQVLEYVARGEVSAALLYRSDARIAGERVVVGPELPADADEPILYQAAVLSAAREPELARALLNLITSKEGQEVLNRHGFLGPPESP
jgi:molybdate transport system substrate-binding protein